MALVGSISGSNGIVYASGSVNPAVDNAYSLGATGAKWSTVLATALSGSLTKLADGTSFLIAGNNVTITTGSNGAVTIASTAAGGGDSFFSSTTAGSIFTTGSAAFRGGETSIDSPSDVGANLFFYVSGSKTSGGRPTSGVSSFGGDLVVTGTLYLGDGSVAGIYNRDGGALLYSTSPTSLVLGQDVILNTNVVKANDGSTAITLSSANVTVAGNAIIGGNITADAEEAKSIFVNNGANNLTLGSTSSTTIVNNLVVSGSSNLSGNVTLYGNSQTVTHTGTGNLTIASNSGNVVVESTIFNGNDVTIPGNLTVNGSVVSIASDNLKVKDSVLLLGSGSTTTNAKAAIAFVSGSSVADRAVIFGTVGGSDTSAVATMDVQDGTLPALNLDFTVLAPMRASKFELGTGGTAFITSSQGNNLNVQASTALTLQSTGNKIFLSPATAGGGSVEFQYAGTSFAAFTGSNGNAVFGATLGKTMAISGSRVELNAGSPGIRFQRDGAQLGAVQGQADTSMSLTSFGSDFAARSLILSGSDLVVGANTANSTGVTFRIGATDYAQFNNFSTDAKFGATGRRMIISGSQIKLNAQTPAGGGVQFEADGNAFLNIMSGTGPGVVIIGAAVGMLSAQLLNTDVTTVDFAGAATALNVGATSGTTTVRNSLQVNGNTTLGNDTGDDITFTGRAASNLLPKTDSFYDLGSPTRRWANIYTGDLHLRNDRGNWTIIEEAEYLTITNNLNGKRFKFVLEEL